MGCLKNFECLSNGAPYHRDTTERTQICIFETKEKQPYQNLQKQLYTLWRLSPFWRGFPILIIICFGVLWLFIKKNFFFFFIILHSFSYPFSFCFIILYAIIYCKRVEVVDQVQGLWWRTNGRAIPLLQSLPSTHTDNKLHITRGITLIFFFQKPPLLFKKKTPS